MAARGRDAQAEAATADREIVISRVISAPREVVFEAFTEVRHLSRWWVLAAGLRDHGSAALDDDDLAS